MGPRSDLRQSHRLRAYDYALDGAYFITIITQDRALLFGDVNNGEMRYSDAGLVTDSWWHSIGRRFPTVLTDEYVVMPNHLHGVLFIGGQVEDDRPETKGGHTGPPLHRGSGRAESGSSIRPPIQPRILDNPSLGTIVGWFKTMTTNDYIRGVKEDGWLSFRGRLWQRNYHDHIIRTDRALHDIRAYILNNPMKWTEDAENPSNL